MIYQSRCRKCRARKTFSKPPLDQRCACGGLYSVDTYRQKGREVSCRCSGFPWAIDNAPHRKGSYSIKNHWYCEYAKPSHDSEHCTQQELSQNQSEQTA